MMPTDEHPPRKAPARPRSDQDRSTILDTALWLLIPTILVLSVYLLAAGHNAPGGGFIGGLVGGAALVLRHLAGTASAVRIGDRITPPLLLGTGLSIAVLAGALPWAFDHDFLTSEDVHVEVFALGDVHVATTLAFDVGVYLIVVGLVAAVLGSLGAEDRP